MPEPTDIFIQGTETEPTQQPDALGELGDAAVIHAQAIPRERRHALIFARFARLSPGESFVLVNTHDPKPLRREFEAAQPNAFGWDYVESGPETWQVRISRVATES